jgi:hypothetical protein
MFIPNGASQKKNGTKKVTPPGEPSLGRLLILLLYSSPKKKECKFTTDIQKQNDSEQTHHNKSKQRKNISYTYTRRTQTRTAELYTE